MKSIVLILSLLLITCFCIGYRYIKSAYPAPSENGSANANPDLGIKWSDTLYKHIPAGLDTTIIVKDADGRPFTFRQYIKPVFNKDAMIYQDRGVWRLQRRTDGARDTLEADNHAVARIERWGFFRFDTVKSWHKKFDMLSRTLAQADYILVLKSKRQMFLQRKGSAFKTFDIDLGKNPVGKKEFENDGKTPEGIYDLDFKYTRDDAYYKSIMTSYPNEAEKQHAKAMGKKPGMAIMIHGTKPDKTTAKDWTAGCIALQNKDMDTLFKYVAEGTLIEIRP